MKLLKNKKMGKVKSTNNINRIAIGNRYGNATRDRFAEMFNTISLTGDSRRV